MIRSPGHEFIDSGAYTRTISILKHFLSYPYVSLCRDRRVDYDKEMTALLPYCEQDRIRKVAGSSGFLKGLS